MHQVLDRRAALCTTPFARDVRRDLSATPKRLQAKYLYDALGSALFEAICALPWYRITRAETRLIDKHADEIASLLADPVLVVELGPGSGAKLSRIARGLGVRSPRARLHLIDISSAALATSARAVQTLATVEVSTDRATFVAGLARLREVHRDGGNALVLLLGSNIGNFDHAASAALLSAIRASVGDHGWLLLGTDLVKSEAELLLAYDDPLGVTAAFNRNLLLRINRELGASFDLARFDHRAVWRPEDSRVEMHLVARAAHDVPIPGAGCVARFAAGESIWTESSHKYDQDDVVAMGREAGFTPRRQWIDEDARFALTMFEADRADHAPRRAW